MAAFGSGTCWNHMFGPPHPAASTYDFSEVESSSRSVPSAAAQNRPTTIASAQSKVTDLIQVPMRAT